MNVSAETVRTRTDVRFEHIVERAVFVLSRAGAVGVLFLFFVWLPRYGTRSFVFDTDLFVYYQTAQRLAHGLPIYMGKFIYPPFFAALIRPAAMMPLNVFQLVWYMIILTAFVAYAVGLAKIAFGRLTLERVLAMAALVELTPGTSETMSLGNIDFIIWAILAWSIPSGRGLALGACLKIYPGFVAVAAVLRKPSVVWRQLGVALALTMFVLGFIGPHVFIEWFRAGVVVTPDCLLLPQNVSLSTGILRLMHVTDFHGTFVRVFYVFFPLLVIWFTFWKTRKWSALAAASAVLIATVWSAPVCWADWLPILNIPLAVWVRGRLGVSMKEALS